MLVRRRLLSKVWSEGNHRLLIRILERRHLRPDENTAARQQLSHATWSGGTSRRTSQQLQGVTAYGDPFRWFGASFGLTSYSNVGRRYP